MTASPSYRFQDEHILYPTQMTPPIFRFQGSSMDQSVAVNPNQDNPQQLLDTLVGLLDKVGDMTEKAAAVTDSSTKWVSATIIVCAITITVVILRYFWMKEKHKVLPKTYSPIIPSDNDGQYSPIPDQHIAVTMPPVQPMVSFSQILGETMERFLDQTARERPIRFTHQDIHELTTNLSSFLGSGGYGEVYKGTFPNGVMIAVKVLKNKHSDKKVQEQFMAEIGTLGRTHHANLVRLYGFCFEPTMRALVYEYMENGSLDKLLFDKNKLVRWEQRYQIAIGVAKGLAYLHEDCQQKIIHYDIKAGNVLLDSKLNPKVADFGLARLCNTESNTGSSQAFITGRGGTAAYAAPELFKQFTPVTNKCDVYSFGLLLLEIIGRRRNHDPDASNDSKVWLASWTWKMFQKGRLLDLLIGCGIEDEYKEEAERMLMVAFMCVHHDPNERPTMSNVVKMLQGEKEISPPSYPFEYTESSGEVKSNVTSTTKVVPDQSHLKPFNSAAEIELPSN